MAATYNQMTATKTNAELAKIEGERKEAEAYATAQRLRTEEETNAHLRSLQMMQTQGNKRRGVGEVRTQRAAAGFDMSQASGGSAEQSVLDAFDAQIANMQLNSSLTSANVLNQAVQLEKDGDLSSLEGNNQASLLRAEAHALGVSSIFTGAAGLTGLVTGGMTDGLSGALSQSSTFSSMSNSFNPYTSSFVQKGWDENMSGYFTKKS